MPKTTAKATTKTKTTFVEQAIVSPELVDEYGTLLRKVEAAEKRLKPHKDKLLQIEGAIRNAVQEHTADGEECTVTGHKFAIDFTAMGKATEILNIKAVALAFEEVEKGLALKLAKFSIGDMREYLTPKVFAKLTKEYFKNARRKKVRELA